MNNAITVRKIPKKTITVLEPKQSQLVDKEKYNQLRVAAYCRVSTDSDEQLTSYNTQKRVYTEMIAAKKEWSLAGIYADEGISGTVAKKRPQFQKLMDDCLSGKVDYIITKSVSRFARNTAECLEYVRMLKARKIGIFFEEQNIDTLKCDSELYLVIYAGFAQSESESMSKNITWAFRKNFENGKVPFNYSRLVGYRKGADGEPEIIPEEAEIIRKIFALFLEGQTPKSICDQLLAEGIATKCGKQKWSVSTIQRILKNEKYCGDAILQKTVTIDCITKTVKKNTGAEAPMYYVKDNHEGIISHEDFNRAQEELVRRSCRTPASTKTSITSQGKYSKYALTEIMHCAECGSRYRRCTWAKNGKKRVVWRCVSRLDYGTKYCKQSPTVSEEEIQSAVIRAINRFYSENYENFMLLMKTTIGDAIGLNATDAEADILQQRVDDLNKKMLQLVNQSIANGTTIDDMDGEFQQIAQEIEQLNRRLKAIQESHTANDNYDRKVQILSETIEQKKQHLNEYDDTLVRQMIECVRIHSDGKVEIIFGGGYTMGEQIK